MIDGVLHPLKKTHWVFVLVDEAFHIINEGDIEQSLVKFAQYSLPELVKILVGIFLLIRPRSVTYFTPRT